MLIRCDQQIWGLCHRIQWSFDNSSVWLRNNACAACLLTIKVQQLLIAGKPCWHADMWKVTWPKRGFNLSWTSRMRCSPPLVPSSRWGSECHPCDHLSMTLVQLHSQVDIPGIHKIKKQLKLHTLDMDAAKARYLSLSLALCSEYKTAHFISIHFIQASVSLETAAARKHRSGQTGCSQRRNGGGSEQSGPSKGQWPLYDLLSCFFPHWTWSCFLQDQLSTEMFSLIARESDFSKILFDVSICIWFLCVPVMVICVLSGLVDDLCSSCISQENIGNSGEHTSSASRANWWVHRPPLNCISIRMLSDQFSTMSLWTDHNLHTPVYGQPLEDHLNRTGRGIAMVLEECCCALLASSLEEEVSDPALPVASKWYVLKC